MALILNGNTYFNPTTLWAVVEEFQEVKHIQLDGRYAPLVGEQVSNAGQDDCRDFGFRSQVPCPMTILSKLANNNLTTK
jgi:hypothetical protein